MTSDFETSAGGLIDALNVPTGRQAGLRAAYAKGVCATGDFLPTETALDFVKNPLFALGHTPVTLRFSVAGGSPTASDKERSVRGLAIRFEITGHRYDLLLVSEPVFFAATVESFVAFLRARVPDPITGEPDVSRVIAYESVYPDGAHQPALLASHPAPASYVSTPYFSNNAFLFTGRDGVTRPARLILEPEVGTHYLAAEQENSLSDNFLEAELKSRLEGGSANFMLYAQLPGPDDSLVDPSSTWLSNKREPLGRLRVLALAAGDCDLLRFLPTNLPSGVGLTDDPILQARHSAYLISQNRRLLTGNLKA